MRAQFREKRKHPRVYFLPNDQLTGQFNVSGGAGEPFPGLILNLSEGGIFFSIQKEEATELKNGMELIMTRFTLGGDPLCEGEIRLEIRWSFSHAVFKSRSFGCRFLEVPEACAGKIRDLVNRKLSRAV